jgi:hypothetical protein
MIKAFVKPFFKTARTHKWFSTQNALISQLRTVTNDLYDVEKRVDILKDVLRQNEAESPSNLPEVRQTIFKFFSESIETYETISEDEELVKRLLEFQKIFTNEPGYKGLGVAFSLTSLILDVKMRKISRNIILKKISDAYTNPDISTLYSLAPSFEEYYLIAQQCNRSDLNDILLDRINELLVNHRNNLSFQGKLSMLQTMLSARNLTEDYKLMAMFHTIMNDLQEATFDQFIDIMDMLKQVFPEKFETYRDELEKKLVSFINTANSPKDFVRVFDFIDAIATEKSYNAALKTVLDNLDSISANDQSIVLYSMAVNGRVDEEVIILLYKNIGQNMDKLSLGSLLKVYFANKYLNIETDFVDFEELQEMVFETSFIQSIKVDELFILLENVLVFESIPDDKRHMAVAEIERTCKAHGPEFTEAFNSIMEKHFASVPKPQP